MHFHIDRQPPSTEEMRATPRCAERSQWRPRHHRNRRSSRLPASNAAHAASVRSSTATCPPSRKPRHPSPRDTGAYVPEMAARIDNDPNLTDGARTLRPQAGGIHLQPRPRNREGRNHGHLPDEGSRRMPAHRAALSAPAGTRRLYRASWSSVRAYAHVRRSCSSALLDPLFPRHRRQKWPAKAGNPEATRKSQNHRLKI